MSPPPSTAAQALQRYGFALLVTGMAQLLQWLLFSSVSVTPYLLSLGAVMLAGWWGGWGPGLVAMGLSALVTGFALVPSSPRVPVPTREVGSLLVFLVLSLLITWLNVRSRTLLRRAEAQGERLRRLFMQAPAMVNTHMGPQHVFDLVHPNTAALLGPRRMVGRPLREALPELEGQGVFEWMDRVYRTGEPFVGKALPLLLARVDKPGEEYFVNFTAQPMHDDQGRIEGVMAFAVDVTPEVLTRRQLEASEARLRMASEVAGVGIWEVDFVTGRRWHNALCDRAYGFDASIPEWTLELFLQHMHPEDRERVQRELSRGVASHPGEFELEFRVVWPDGSVHWLVTRNLTHRDASGKPLRMMGTTLDITARKQTEQALERAVRLRDEFLSVAAHELKTPLTPLSLKLQSLARALLAEPDAPAVEQRRKDVDVMRRQVHRLSALVTNLLDVSRIGIGRLNLQLEPVELAELVREVVSRMAPEAERARSPLVLDLGGPWSGRLDRLRLEQVVENLLSNAIKYGAGRPIHVSVRGEGERARLVVRDEGIGVAPEALGRIFDRFERAVSERHYGGLGLGLYITREIVSALGGTVRVESRPAEGATFTVELPREPPPPVVA